MLKQSIHRIKNMLGFRTDPSTAAVLEAVEMVVDNASPGIRTIRGYKNKLIQPVTAALAHIDQVIETVPGPIDVTDPPQIDRLLAKHYFNDNGQMKIAIREDPKLGHYFHGNDGQDFFSLLTMKRQVKVIYGSRQQGEIVVRDMAMRSVDFSEHRFRVPSVSLEDAAHRLRSRVLQWLAHQAMECMTEEQARIDALNELKNELAVKIRIMATPRAQMDPECDDDTCRTRYRDAQALLKSVEDELNGLKSKKRDRGYHLDCLLQVLNHPEEYVAAAPVAMHRERMGIVIEGNPKDQQDEIRVADIRLNPGRQISGVFLKCNCRTMMAVSEYL